jgi:hypothetical protein
MTRRPRHRSARPARVRGAEAWARRRRAGGPVLSCGSAPCWVMAVIRVCPLAARSRTRSARLSASAARRSPSGTSSNGRRSCALMAVFSVLEQAAPNVRAPEVLRPQPGRCLGRRVVGPDLGARSAHIQPDGQQDPSGFPCAASGAALGRRSERRTRARASSGPSRARPRRPPRTRPRRPDYPGSQQHALHPGRTRCTGGRFGARGYL